MKVRACRVVSARPTRSSLFSQRQTSSSRISLQKASSSLRATTASKPAQSFSKPSRSTPQAPTHSIYSFSIASPFSSKRFLFTKSIIPRQDTEESAVPEVFESLPGLVAPKKERAKQFHAVCHRTHLGISPKKMQYVTRQVQGLSCNEALAQLQFSPAKPAKYIKEAIISARYNAENLYNLNSDRLVVTLLEVGRATIYKRLNYHARNKHGTRHIRRSHLKVVLREMPEVPGEKRIGKWGSDRKFIRGPLPPNRSSPPVFRASSSASSSSSAPSIQLPPVT